MHNEDFAKKIKILRVEKLMMSQTEFANLLNVSYETINRYENGKSNPTFKVKRKIIELMKKYKMEVE